MQLLPHWVVPNNNMAFNDLDSATAIEMVAKIYHAMNSLITEYNGFVENTNQLIEDFETSTAKDIELFKVGIRQEFQDFIDTVDLKMKNLENDNTTFKNSVRSEIENQNQRIANAENYMKNNIVSTTQNLVERALENEEIYAKLNYDAETKALSLVLADSEV